MLESSSCFVLYPEVGGLWNIDDGTWGSGMQNLCSSPLSHTSYPPNPQTSLFPQILKAPQIQMLIKKYSWGQRRVQGAGHLLQAVN